MKIKLTVLLERAVRAHGPGTTASQAREYIAVNYPGHKYNPGSLTTMLAAVRRRVFESGPTLPRLISAKQLAEKYGGVPGLTGILNDLEKACGGDFGALKQALVFLSNLGGGRPHDTDRLGGRPVGP